MVAGALLLYLYKSLFQAIRNVLIWESEDLGPIGNRFQQQTVDQEHNGKSKIE